MSGLSTYPALTLLLFKIELSSFVKLDERWKEFIKTLAVHSPELNLQIPLLLTSHSINASLQIPSNLLQLKWTEFISGSESTQYGTLSLNPSRLPFCKELFMSSMEKEKQRKWRHLNTFFVPLTMTIGRSENLYCSARWTINFASPRPLNILRKLMTSIGVIMQVNKPFKNLLTIF